MDKRRSDHQNQQPSQQNEQQCNSYVMFQRLFKRFKKSHDDDDEAGGNNENEQHRDSQNNTKDLSTPKDESDKKLDDTKGDDESVSSDSSEYSNYDHLGQRQHQSPPIHEHRSNDDDDQEDDDGSVASSTSTSSSSYSDYDDYYFLTAVVSAAAARQASLRKQQKPPSTITTTTSSTIDADDKDKSTTSTPPDSTTKVTPLKDNSKKDNPIVSTTASQQPTFQLEYLARTHFPDFFQDSEDGVPGAILSDGSESSDDEETIQRKTIKYRTKEDEDVAVFMDLARRMSLKSLLHLLQGHVQSQNEQYRQEYMKQYHAALVNYRSSASSSSHGSLSTSSSYSSILSTSKDDVDEKEVTDADTGATDMADDKEIPTGEEKKEEAPSPKRHHKRHHHKQTRKPSLQKKKQFRWAEVTNDQVRVVTHEIESIKSYSNLWWQPHEMHTIRADLVDTVKFYRKHRPNYIQSVEIVAKHAGEITSTNQTNNNIPQSHQQQVLEDHMKSLMSAEHSYARGLETHIVKMLSEHRKATVTAVLEEQYDCQECGDDYDSTIYCLREQSLAYTSMSTKFAYAMARCDQIDALKASMSSWTT